jgi:hypothetical protein
MLAFFGLTSDYRKKLFYQIHEIVFYGRNYDWHTIYNMPIWLRKFTFQSILDSLNEESKKSNPKNKNTTSIDIANTNKENLSNLSKDIPVTYKTKSSKK